MILELNLVKVQPGVLANKVGELLERKTYNVEDDASAIESLIKFLGDNVDLLSTIIPDKDFITRISNLKTLSPDQFASLRFVLVSFGIDVWGWVVAENQQLESVSDDKFEFNVVDKLQHVIDSFNMDTKFQLAKEGMVTSNVYQKISDSFELFSNGESGLFKNDTDPLKNQIAAVKDAEGPLGAAGDQAYAQLENMLSFVGKEIYVIK